VIEVAELKVKLEAAVPPKVTAVTPVKFVPEIVTTVPPVSGPLLGETAPIVGAGMKVNWSAPLVDEMPPAVVTLTSTVPVPVGAVAVIEVAEFTVNVEAGVAANATAVAPVNPVPVIVTTVPPEAGPDVGEIPVTAGAAT
jgi:hypothetical protein